MKKNCSPSQSVFGLSSQAAVRCGLLCSPCLQFFSSCSWERLDSTSPTFPPHCLLGDIAVCFPEGVPNPTPLAPSYMVLMFHVPNSVVAFGVKVLACYLTQDSRVKYDSLSFDIFENSVSLLLQKKKNSLLLTSNLPLRFVNLCFLSRN